MEIEVSELRENTGSITDNLRNMPIGEENAKDIPLADAANIRGLITQIHKKGDHKFSTVKTDTGIKVWRTA